MSLQIKRPYAGITKGSLWAVPIILVLSVLLQLVGVDPVLVWILGGILAFVCLLMGVIMNFMSGRMYKELQWLAAGNAWAYWQYDPAEWQQFMDDEWKRSRRKVMWALLAAPLAALLFLTGGTSWAVVAFVVVAILWYGLYYGVQRYYAKQRATAGAVLIGPPGCYLGTTYTSWTGAGSRLASVKLVTENPYRIEFQVETTSVGTTVTTTVNTVRVAVPRGREAEAQALVQRFYAPQQQQQ